MTEEPTKSTEVPTEASKDAMIVNASTSTDEVALGSPSDTIPAAETGTSVTTESPKIPFEQEPNPPTSPSAGAASNIRYPNAFYCPKTHEVFRSPVVASDGISYEESSVAKPVDTTMTEDKATPSGDKNESSDEENQQGLDNTPNPEYYPNRALQAIIEEHVAKVVGLANSSRRRWSHLAAWATNDRPLPDGYYCPITLLLIHEPVIDPEGYSFEKVAIESWIQVNGASPVTRQMMTLADLRPNKTLANLMEEEAKASLANESSASIYAVWKQWQEEGPPQAPTLPADVATGSSGSSSLNVRPLSRRSSSFPMTPEELEAARRARRVRRYKKANIWTLLFIVLALLAWLVPAFATVLLILVLVGVVITAYVSSNNRKF